jgi:AAA domain
MSAIPMPLQDHEIARALEIARELAHAGVPIFLASPNPASKSGYAFPPQWETSTADPSVVDHWRPGMALCAVGGHLCDFLDIDPRNGGTETSERLWQAGMWPNGYGQAATPSGGIHEVIQPLGVGKGEVAPGVDLQGGRRDGGGRGFVFIAPTVRASKVDGIARPYRWLTEPDIPRLIAWRGEASGVKLGALLPERKTKLKPNERDDIYGEETHTVTSANRTIAAKSAEVTNHIRARGWAGFRDVLNGAAYTLGAYVGSDYMTYEQAFEVLESAIACAGYPINDESAHTVEVGIADGARYPIKVVEPSRPFARTADAGGDFGTRLIDAADLDELPDPEPLVKGWLYQDTTARIVGQPGAYKSFVALDIALSVATGRDWHGRPVAQTPVLYVVGEGLADYKRRVKAWCAHNEVEQSELRGKLLLTRGAVQIGGEEWPALTQWVLDNKSGLVVVDTQARASVGFEENSSSDQGLLIRHCDALREQTGGVLLLVHHTGHANGDAAERGRGSSAWRAAVDSELLLRKTGERTAALRNDRQKSAESGQEVAVQMVKVAGSLAVQIGEDIPGGTGTAVEVSKCGEDDKRVMAAVRELMAKDQRPSMRAVIATAAMKAARAKEALDRLTYVSQQLIMLPGERGAQVYRPNPNYSESLGEVSMFVTQDPEG